MSDSIQSDLASTDTVAGSETVFALPPAAAPIVDAPPAIPFTGLVLKVAPSTIDPASHVRVWKDVVDEVGDQKLVILDIADIAEMDRRAVTAMVQSFKRLERAGIQFCLSAPQRQVEALLELLGVLHLVETFATVEEAKESFHLDD